MLYVSVKNLCNFHEGSNCLQRRTDSLHVHNQRFYKNSPHHAFIQQTLRKHFTRARLVLIDNKLNKTRSFLPQDSTPPSQPIYSHSTRYTFQNALHICLSIASVILLGARTVLIYWHLVNTSWSLTYCRLLPSMSYNQTKALACNQLVGSTG